MATLDDLGDVGDELKRSKDEFLGILDFYDTHRADLMADVASRLQDITNPDNDHAEVAIDAARELDEAIGDFGDRWLSLMNAVGYVGVMTNSAISSLQIKYFNSISQVSVHFDSDQNPLAAVNKYIKDLETVHERSMADGVDIAVLVGTQAIDAFDAATDVILAQFMFLVKYIDATSTPTTVVNKKGKSYWMPIARNAAVTATVFRAGEEALKRIPALAAGQIPLAGIAVSLLGAALEVKREVEHLHEKQALWQALIEKHVGRNITDEVLDAAEKVRNDDVDLTRLVDTLQAAGDQLYRLSRALLHRPPPEVK